MTLNLRPEFQKFIDEQVQAGLYPSPEAVIETALADMQHAADPDDETIAAINEAKAQADRGEGIDFDTFRAEILSRHGGAK